MYLECQCSNFVAGTLDEALCLCGHAVYCHQRSLQQHAANNGLIVKITAVKEKSNLLFDSHGGEKYGGKSPTAIARTNQTNRHDDPPHRVQYINNSCRPPLPFVPSTKHV